MVHDVFISYSNKDKTIADSVCAKLEERRIRCWIAPRDIPAGQNFAKSIINAIDSCKVFILIWSNYTNTSEHILNEINQAFDQGITIIPFRIEEVVLTTEMRYYFGRTHWLDALTPPLEKHIRVLAETILAILESKRDIIPEPVPVKADLDVEKITREKNNPLVTPGMKPGQVPDGKEQIEPSHILDAKTRAARQVKYKRLIPIVSVVMAAAALVTLISLYMLKRPNPGSIAPIPSPSVTLTVPSPSPGTPTPTVVIPTQTSTPFPAWMTDFSAPILAAIEGRTPDFQDDFTERKQNWLFEGGSSQECQNTHAYFKNGKLQLQSDPVNCSAWARLDLDLQNFVVQVDIDLQQLKSMGNLVIFKATDNGDVSNSFFNDGKWDIVYCTGDFGYCDISRWGYFSSVPTGMVTVTIILYETNNAVYVNDTPIYYMNYATASRTLPSLFAMTVQRGADDTSINRVEFDNLKIWDLDKIENLTLPLP